MPSIIDNLRSNTSGIKANFDGIMKNVRSQRTQIMASEGLGLRRMFARRGLSMQSGPIRRMFANAGTSTASPASGVRNFARGGVASSRTAAPSGLSRRSLGLEGGKIYGGVSIPPTQKPRSHITGQGY